MKHWKFYVFGGILGLAGGFLYWHFWGCEYGCRITGSPINSSIYGLVMGALLGGSAADFIKKSEEKAPEKEDEAGV